MTHVIKARIDDTGEVPVVMFDIVKHFIDPDGGCSVPPCVVASYKSETSADWACKMLNKYTGELPRV